MTERKDQKCGVIIKLIKQVGCVVCGIFGLEMCQALASHRNMLKVALDSVRTRFYHINPLMLELNPAAQHCLMRFFTGDFAS
jgi:predicted LPLAT superfamily acyltransferase